MKNIVKPSVLMSAALFLFSCNNSNEPTTSPEQKETETNIISYTELEKAAWLVGVWQNSSPEGISTEIWEKVNDSTLVGNNYFVIEQDTVFSESITLEQKGNAVFYIPLIADQNEGQPIKFTLTSSTDKVLVFENPSHDFPQKITYTLVTKDSLLAEISGMMEGELSTQQFPMTRIK